MVEIASMAAETQQDWTKAAKYNRYLIDNELNVTYLKKQKDSLYRAELSLATSLIHIAQKILGDAVFTIDEEDKIQNETKAQAQIDEARVLLINLSNIDGDNALTITTRIRAKQLLEQLGV